MTLPDNLHSELYPRTRAVWADVSRRSHCLAHVCSFPIIPFLSPPPAIRFGRMPRSEKAKLKAEILTCEHDIEDSETADLKSLAKRIYEAYLKNFNMNKVKARVILAGKASNNPVGVSAACLPACPALSALCQLERREGLRKQVLYAGKPVFVPKVTERQWNGNIHSEMLKCSLTTPLCWV